MPLTIVRQDITKMNVDAIVNAANTELQMGGGVCGAIFRAAGERELQAACDQAAPIGTGEAAITPGFGLPSKYVIHAAGPVYNVWHKRQCRAQLRSAYIEALKLAEQNGCESIVFPLISSGIYGYPKDEALEVARSAIEDFLRDHDMEVYLAVFDKSSFQISKALLGDVKEDALRQVAKPNLSAPAPAMAAPMAMPAQGLDDLLERAGYALSHASKFDVIVEYFIVNGKYDIFEINEVLFAYDQPLLGA